MLNCSMDSTIWTEKTKFPGNKGHLHLDADSYNKWIEDACYVCEPDLFEEEISEDHNLLAEVGKYSFYIRTFPTHTTRFNLFGFSPGIKKVRAVLDIAQGRRRGTVSFDGPVHIPILMDSDKVWMSLTPMEVFSQRSGLRKAKGRVLIAGLGMGWLTSRVLSKKSVKSVTQVEMIPEVMSFFGGPLSDSKKLELVEGDIWSLLDNELDIQDYDTILFDIWPRYGDAHFDRKFQKLKRSHEKVWGWGDFGAP